MMREGLEHIPVLANVYVPDGHHRPHDAVGRTGRLRGHG